MSRVAHVAAVCVILFASDPQPCNAQYANPYAQTAVPPPPDPWVQDGVTPDLTFPPPDGYGWGSYPVDPHPAVAPAGPGFYSAASELFDFRGSIKPQLEAQLGLGLFEPRWSDESFKTLVPAAAAPAFGFVGKGRADDFTYEPSLTVKFNVEGPAAFGKNRAFSYTQLELVGKLNEDPMSGVDVATFDTTSTIRLREYRLQLAQWDCPFIENRFPADCLKPGDRADLKCWIEHDVPQLTLLLDVSYRDTLQQYESLVRRGDNSSQVSAKAEYKGLGIATVAKFRYPLPDRKPLTPLIVSVEDENGNEIERTTKHVARFAVLLNAYGNFSVGRNDRFSSLIVDVESPGLIDSSSQSRLDKTEFVASGGFDTGIEWNTVRDQKLISAIVAFTLESSSNIGPINPQDPAPGSNDFLIYGFLVAGGIQF